DCDRTNNLMKNLIRGPYSMGEETEEKKEKATNCDEIYHEKAKRLFTYKEAPEYIKHNSFILSGYRGILNTQLCLESMFWWTNETINIWSHIFGFVLFVAVAIRDVWSLDVYAQACDKFIVGFVLVCFQMCMLLSALYHTFSCRSERDCDFFLSFDLFGIALSLLAIYTSGIYYAFWCTPTLRYFYTITVTVIFVMAMALHVPSFNVNSNVKMLVFVAWAAYGVVPTFHWAVHMGGLDNPLVLLLLPKVVGMYIISGTAFLIYVTKVPERFYTGKFDYFGHSHQWWHILIVAALYYWHCTGMIYLEYRFNHVCANPGVII
ncbi:progestin and adipoQ receptor family member 3, partial [Asbolus verrucosus]